MVSNLRIIWIVIFTVSFTFYEIMATVCSDAVSKYTNDSALRMCESGNAVGKQIFVDTFDSALYGVGNCHCDINFITNETTTMKLSWNIVDNLLPVSASCGSVVFIADHSNNFILAFPCIILSKLSDQLDTNLSYRVVWSLYNTAGIPGYCVLIASQSSDVSLNITCIQTDRPLITSSVSSTTTSISSTETSTTTKVPYIETTLPTLPDDIDTTTSSSTTSLPGTAISDGEIQTTKSLDTSQNKDEQKVIIIVPIVIVGLALLIAAAVFILVRKRKSQKNSNGTKTSVFDVVYENTGMENEERALKTVAYGSQYTQLHVYSNNASKEYSVLQSAQSVKNPIKVEAVDKDAYIEMSVDKVIYYNQK